MASIVAKHNHDCRNYVAITNCPLTAQDKDELKLLLMAADEGLEHIAVLGESDLQDSSIAIPRSYPSSRRYSASANSGNWLTGACIVVHLSISSPRNREIATFVATSPYLKAIDLLHKQHFCVLSGPPKMGKTCTAYALAASFSALTYEVFDLRNQRDFYDAYKNDAKQLFICDDVFGDISLQTSQTDDWTRGFLRLLGSLGRDHKLIWTARVYP